MIAEKIESFVPTSEQQWLEARTQDVTSTEVPALFGLSPYLTAFELWHHKKSAEVVAFDGNERVIWGSRLQDAIAGGIAKDRGWSIRKMVEYVRRPGLRLGASFDFRVQDRPGLDGPADSLLEVKNVDSLVYREKWDVSDDDNLEAPPHIEIQVQTQLAVSGLKHATIGALVGGNRVILIERDRDEKIISAIEKKVDAFWASIAAGAAPKPNFVRDADFIAELYGYAKPGSVLDAASDKSIDVLVATYREAAARAKAADEDKSAAKAELLTKIGDAEKVLGTGWSISAGVTGPTTVEAYERKGFRNFRVNVQKQKPAKV